MIRPTPTARWRSLAKAVTWRVFGSLVTFLLGFVVVYLLGHRRHPVEAAQVGGALAIGETLTKIGLFYIHDRVWERLPFGRADTENIPTAPDETDY
jgi:uncharacterized membrane protein